MTLFGSGNGRMAIHPENAKHLKDIMTLFGAGGGPMDEGRRNGQ